MTTIAFRDGVMAADSQAHADGVKFRNETKLFRVKGNVIGLCGADVTGQMLLNWYENGAPEFTLTSRPSIADDYGFGALVLNKSGLLYVDQHFQPVAVREPFHAIGSGAMAAIAAMYCGKNAIQAVQVAARVDRDTGGTVRHMRLDDTKCRK